METREQHCLREFMPSTVSITSRPLDLSLLQVQGGNGGRPKPASLQGAPAQPAGSPEEGLLSLIPGKENGVSWNKPAGLSNGLDEGAVSGVVWEAEGRGDSARPPPVPPRRKTPGGSLESPVSPGTGCFSKLHDWYGKEVAELRVEWLQSQ